MIRSTRGLMRFYPNMPDKVSEYKKGKKNLIGLFSGEVKKISKGKADMQAVNKILNQKLNR